MTTIAVRQLSYTASDALAKLKSFTRIGGAGDPLSDESAFPTSSMLFSICTML
jgi:hypothetical protein